MICPNCHTEVRESDYFCFNCGKDLKPKPPSTDIQSQIILYIKSIFLPPFGIFWALPYLKTEDRKSKTIGTIAIIITLIIFILTLIWTKNLVNSLDREISKQMNYSGLY